MPDEEIDIDALLESGALECCAACGELSAHSWRYVTEKAQHYRLDYEPGEIAHVGAASGCEWECGHCGANNVELGSPLLAEVYTHVPAESWLEQ